MKLTEILQRRFEAIKKERTNKDKGLPPESWIPTRLREFDKRGGHKRKMIALYGADTGGGKSLWKWHLAWAAATLGYSVSLVDMEDPEEMLAERAFAHSTGINSALMVNAELTDKHISQMAIALAEMEGWADNVEVHLGVKTGVEALELLEESPADLEVVDYLSAFPHGKHGREREISDFMWGWTKHVQQHKVAGVALAQISPDVSERGLEKFDRAEARRKYQQDSKDRGPDISGFRAYDTSHLMWCTDSGRTAKEQGFMFRPGRILKRLGFKAEDNVMEFDFPKRNRGTEGRIRVALDLKTARFTDLAEGKNDSN